MKFSAAKQEHLGVLLVNNIFWTVGIRRSVRSRKSGTFLRLSFYQDWLDLVCLADTLSGDRVAPVLAELLNLSPFPPFFSPNVQN